MPSLYHTSTSSGNLPGTLSSLWYPALCKPSAYRKDTDPSPRRHNHCPRGRLRSPEYLLGHSLHHRRHRRPHRHHLLRPQSQSCRRCRLVRYYHHLRRLRSPQLRLQHNRLLHQTPRRRRRRHRHRRCHPNLPHCRPLRRLLPYQDPRYPVRWWCLS